MVSGVSIFFMIASILAVMLLLAGLIIYYYKRDKISIFAIILGVLTFIIFQILTRIPLLSLLQTQEWFISFSSNFALLWIFLGLTAGIFEEMGRFIMMKLFMRKKLSRANGIAFGIGHGGIEAILLFMLPMVNNLIISFAINAGTYSTKIAPNLPLMQSIQIEKALISTAPIMFTLGGVERILAITIQIAFSVLVMHGVKTGKFRYVIYAILAHMAVNTPLGFLQRMGIGSWGIEIFVAICALVGLVYIKKSKASFGKLEEAQMEAFQQEQTYEV